MSGLSGFGGSGMGGSMSDSAFKAPVRAATTAPITLATDLENGDTIDGVVLATGNRVLVKDQASGAENGIYIVAASGAPSRATDFDSSSNILPGSLIPVTEGTVNGDTLWILATNAPITVGVTVLTFVQVSAAGTITGAGTTFRVSKFTTANSIGDSNISDDGTIVIVTSSASVNPVFAVRAAPAQTGDLQQWLNSAASVLSCVTADGRVVINATAPLGTEVLYANGDAYIQGKLTVTGSLDPTDLLLTGGNKKIGATDAGPIYIAPFADSDEAIQFRRADATTVLLRVDTTTGYVCIGSIVPTQKLTVDGNLIVFGTVAGVDANFGIADAEGWTLNAVAANPGGTTTLWANSGDSDKLYYGANPVGASSTAGINFALETRTVNFIVSTTDSGKYYNNLGAGGDVTATLPPAVGSPGINFSFTIATNQPFKIQADGTDEIYFGDLAAGAGGFWQSATVGNTMQIYSDGVGAWFVTQAVGSGWINF